MRAIVMICSRFRDLQQLALAVWTRKQRAKPHEATRRVGQSPMASGMRICWAMQPLFVSAMRGLVAEWSGDELAVVEPAVVVSEPAIDETEAEQLSQQVALLRSKHGWSASDIYTKAGFDQDETRAESSYKQYISYYGRFHSPIFIKSSTMG